MTQRFLRDALARKHAADFTGALLRRQFLDRCVGAAFRGVLFDGIMMIGEPCDLREMRDAQHLARCGELLQSPAHRFRRAAADAGVHFVEHQCSRSRSSMRRAGEVQAFSASATREISPPDAILSSGFGSSPTFGEIRNSIASAPDSDHGAGETRISTRVFSMASAASSVSTFAASDLAACLRTAVSFAAAASNDLRELPRLLCLGHRADRSNVPRLPTAPSRLPETRAPLRPSRRTCASTSRAHPVAIRHDPAAPDQLPDSINNAAARATLHRSRLPQA